MLEQIGSGKGYVDMSTVDAATSTKISEVSPSAASVLSDCLASFPTLTFSSSIYLAIGYCVQLQDAALSFVGISVDHEVV